MEISTEGKISEAVSAVMDSFLLNLRAC